MESPDLERVNSVLERRRTDRDQGLENGPSGLRPQTAVHASGIEFVGRLGGNQAFTATKDQPDYDETIKKTPDARLYFTWAESFDLRPFGDPDLWLQALIEGWATCMLTFLVGATAYSLAPKAG
jgi:hypothetical protein